MSDEIRSFKDLRVWKRAYELCLSIYRLSSGFPKYELYGIAEQMRRASVSIVSNIAEGYSRRSRKDYARFLQISYSSLSELETQILLSKDLGYMQESDYKVPLNLKEEVGGMLYKLIEKLRT